MTEPSSAIQSKGLGSVRRSGLRWVSRWAVGSAEMSALGWVLAMGCRAPRSGSGMARWWALMLAKAPVAPSVWEPVGYLALESVWESARGWVSRLAPRSVCTVGRRKAGNSRSDHRNHRSHSRCCTSTCRNSPWGDEWEESSSRFGIYSGERWCKVVGIVFNGAGSVERAQTQTGVPVGSKECYEQMDVVGSVTVNKQ